MKILVIDNSTAMTGALQSVLRSSHALRNKFKFYFVLPTKSTACAYVEQEGIEVFRLPLRELRKSWVAMLAYFPFLFMNTMRLRSILHQHNIDVILSNDFYNMVPALYKSFGGKVPYITYVRIRPSRFPRKLVAVWKAAHLRWAERIICVSKTVRDEFAIHGKVVIIPNEIPIDQCSRKVPSEERLILYPANYIEGKGQDSALMSFVTIAAEFPGWRLRFVGGTMNLPKNERYKGKIVDLSRKLGIEASVEWKEFAVNMATEYKQASLVLMLSHSEAFSMVCLEAMFYGCALIATRCGGPEELITHNFNGILVDIDDIEGISEAIRLLIVNSDVRKRLASEARNTAISNYNLDLIAGKLEKVYLEASMKRF